MNRERCFDCLLAPILAKDSFISQFFWEQGTLLITDATFASLAIH